MTKIEILGTELVVARPVPWQKKKGLVIKSMPYTAYKPTGPQMKARIELAEKATAAYGKKGLVNGMPAVAVEVRNNASKGVGVHGGKSPATRRKESHAAAAGSIASMKAELARMS